MEKFSNWRDKSTGILPFLPPTRPTKTSYLDVVLRIPVFVLKLPFFILLVSLYILTSPITPLNHIVLRLYLLLICNLWNLPNLKQPNFKGNQLVVVNFSSFIDVLILTYLQPNCIFLVNDLQGEIRQLSMWQLLMKSVSVPDNSGVLIKDINELPRGKLIWYLPEGTTSNNKCLLQMDLHHLPCETRDMKTLTMIKPVWVNTPVPLSIGQLLWLQLSNLKTLKISMKLSTSVTTVEEVKLNLTLNKLKNVKLGINDKLQFLKAYAKKNSY